MYSTSLSKRSISLKSISDAQTRSMLERVRMKRGRIKVLRLKPEEYIMTEITARPYATGPTTWKGVALRRAYFRCFKRLGLDSRMDACRLASAISALDGVHWDLFIRSRPLMQAFTWTERVIEYLDTPTALLRRVGYTKDGFVVMTTAWYNVDSYLWEAK